MRLMTYVMEGCLQPSWLPHRTGGESRQGHCLRLIYEVALTRRDAVL